MIGDPPKVVLFNVRQLQKGRLELLKSLDSHLGKLHAIFQRSQRWSTELPFLGRMKKTTLFFFLLKLLQFIVVLQTRENLVFSQANEAS